ncbi:MAG: NAD(P)/FAD-dependent oxidoreductase [Bacteroidota bacterium]
MSGAGPAGSMASAFLARVGVPHLLIDKAIFPRDKICGDALSGKVFSVLKKLDEHCAKNMVLAPDAFQACEGIMFAAPNGKTIDVPFKSNRSQEQQVPSGFVSKRLVFDHFLHQYIDRSKTELREGHELIDIKKSEGKLVLDIQHGKLNHTIETKLLIACDGERSLASSFLGGNSKDLDHYSAGIRGYYKNVEGLHPDNFIELHFIKDFLPGYLWIFPLPGGMANVGVGMLSSHVAKKRFNLREAMLNTISNHPQLSKRFEKAALQGKLLGWGLPLGSKRKKLSGDRIILTGDAGSLIDPFTGEGISNAMFSGMAAAEIACQAFKANDYSSEFLSAFDTRVYNRLGSELMISRKLQQLCKYPFLFNMVVNKASKNKAFRETISCMFDDLDLRAKLKSPMFYLKLAFGDKD